METSVPGCVCVCVCVRACVRACVRVCVCVCMWVRAFELARATVCEILSEFQVVVQSFEYSVGRNATLKAIVTVNVIFRPTPPPPRSSFQFQDRLMPGSVHGE